jgi:RND family efflux transporter MFP subunit
MIWKLCRRNLLLVSAAVMAGTTGLVTGPFSRMSKADAPSDSTAAPVTAIGITKPSRESKLAFAAPGLVVDVGVKDGDVVTKDQILASQDSREDEIAYDSMKLEADSDEKIKYSVEDAASKRVKFKRVSEMFDNHVASPSEVEEADLAVKLAEAQIALAELEHKQKIDDAKKQKVKVDLEQLRSPYDGIIEKILINPGEMADPQSRDGAIVVAQWDPLWVELHLPSSQAAQLKLGQTLQVKYDGGDWQSAKVIFFEHVDAASDTQMVRMEMPNPGNSKPAGLHILVKLPEKVVALAGAEDRR